MSYTVEIGAAPINEECAQRGRARDFEALIHHTASADRVPCLLDLLKAVVGVVDMSDPEHPSFADSAADCLDELLRHEAGIRALLARAETYGQQTLSRGSS